MARFSTNTKAKSRKTPDTTNAAGEESYSIDDKLKLIGYLSTSFATDKYYKSSDSQIDDLVDLIQGGTIDPLFVAKAAIYARDQLNMRTITHIAAASLAKTASGKPWLTDFYNSIVVRPDDITEILAYYSMNFADKSKTGKKYPAAMKKGFAKALARFDEYQLAKYKGTGNLKLVDAMRITHAKGPLMDKLSKGSLAVPHTWETKLSAAGPDADKKASVWADLIKGSKLGYMALLRNLKNIDQQADKETLEKALKILVDPDRIRASRQLPFRFYTAYKTLQDQDLKSSREILSAVSKACDISCSNINLEFKGKTLVAIDTSGSMRSPCAGSRNLQCIEAGMLFAAAVYKAVNGSDILGWADYAKYININPELPLVDMVRQLSQHNFGYGTNISSIFKNAKPGYDRIIVFSDMQSWFGDSPEAARGTYSSKTWVHTFDLSHYGTSLFDLSKMSKNKLSFLSGFSEKILRLLSLVESDPSVLVSEIERVNFN
jgi:60 kDa SS-A/Ro ribonucleoprotein